jgi:hypothetical protein
MAALAGGAPPPPPAAAGGGDPMAALAGAGGDPTKAAAYQERLARSRIAEQVKAAVAYQRSGRFRFGEAKTAQERALRDNIKRCIAEIVR